MLTAGYAAEVREDIHLKSAAKREQKRAAELLSECNRSLTPETSGRFKAVFGYAPALWGTLAWDVCVSQLYTLVARFSQVCLTCPSFRAPVSSAVLYHIS